MQNLSFDDVKAMLSCPKMKTLRSERHGMGILLFYFCSFVCKILVVRFIIRNFVFKIQKNMHFSEKDKEYTFWQNVAFYVLFAIWYVLSLIPMCVHYAFSTLAYLVLYHLVRYRRPLVRQNLSRSFPNKSQSEIKSIERQFYQHFCDIMMESVKYMSISKSEMRRRVRVNGVEFLHESCRKGRSCCVYLGHYGNWEWLSALPLFVDCNISQPVQLYHPLENKVFDRLVAYTRQRMGGKNIPVAESVRHMVRYRKEGRPLIIGFIADQVPLYHNIHYWTDFLHQDTPIFTGPERIAKKFDMDVYYADIRRVSRGHYEYNFRLLSTDPNSLPENELTEMYNKELEKTIQAAPPYWLWSHNRWKRNREEWRQQMGIEK